mmetsp:Transcript_33592/g.37534  ORF Transcript_33592/g.37534 Transcript_33592/m.37534 type:complete len:87 (+) Transcript_33592:238-498(+)
MVHTSSSSNGSNQQQGISRQNFAQVIPSALFTILPYHQTTTTTITTTTTGDDSNNNDRRRWNSNVINPSSGKIDILASALKILSAN